MTADPVEPAQIIERVLQILEEGSTVATYKYAVLLALLDLCVELTDQYGEPPVGVTTRQLAHKVVELYWPQARAWGGEKPVPLLRQNASKGSEIVARVHAFRRTLEIHGTTAPVARARLLDPMGWEALLRSVEWTLIEMPLPKLQRVGGHSAHWLYAISWDDRGRAPTPGQVRAYQEGRHSAFDNQIRLLPGVGVALARLHALLRPFIHQHWSAKVASLNDLGESQLTKFLFGTERASLDPVRAGLVDLQHGACFYCGGRLNRGEVHVDHFLPWSRHPDDALANLVAADRACNENKRDYLADHVLVARWRERSGARAPDLAAIGSEARWEVGIEPTLGAARALYLPLPEETRLWAGRNVWVAADRQAVRMALS